MHNQKLFLLNFTAKPQIIVEAKAISLWYVLHVLRLLAQPSSQGPFSSSLDNGREVTRGRSCADVQVKKRGVTFFNLPSWEWKMGFITPISEIKL